VQHHASNRADTLPLNRALEGQVKSKNGCEVKSVYCLPRAAWKKSGGGTTDPARQLSSGTCHWPDPRVLRKLKLWGKRLKLWGKRFSISSSHCCIPERVSELQNLKRSGYLPGLHVCLALIGLRHYQTSSAVSSRCSWQRLRHAFMTDITTAAWPKCMDER